MPNQRCITRWNPKSFHHKHGAYLRLNRPKLVFAKQKYGHKYGASRTANCIPKQTLSFTYVWNSSNSTMYFWPTSLQNPVWDDPYVATHRARGETTLVFTWWCFAVLGKRPQRSVPTFDEYTGSMWGTAKHNDSVNRACGTVALSLRRH